MGSEEAQIIIDYTIRVKRWGGKEENWVWYDDTAFLPLVKKKKKKNIKKNLRDFIFQKTKYEKLEIKTRIIKSLVEEEIPSGTKWGVG